MGSFSSSKPQLRRGAPIPTSFSMFSTRPPATAAILTASSSDSTAGSTAPPGRAALAISALFSASGPSRRRIILAHLTQATPSGRGFLIPPRQECQRFRKPKACLLPPQIPRPVKSGSAPNTQFNPMSRLTETLKCATLFRHGGPNAFGLEVCKQDSILGLLREVPAQVPSPKHVLQRSRGRLAVSARKVRLTPLLKGAPNGVTFLR